MASRVVPAAVIVLLLGGCATQAPKALYGWGSYEDLIYASTTKADGVAPERQIEIMTKDRATIAAAGQRLPPGWRVHLAQLYAQTGHLDQARTEIEAEKTAFPESGVFCDTLLASLNHSQKVMP
jgi:hypothetical protein